MVYQIVSLMLQQVEGQETRWWSKRCLDIETWQPVFQLIIQWTLYITFRLDNSFRWNAHIQLQKWGVQFIVGSDTIILVQPTLDDWHPVDIVVSYSSQIQHYHFIVVYSSFGSQLHVYFDTSYSSLNGVAELDVSNCCWQCSVHIVVGQC